MFVCIYSAENLLLSCHCKPLLLKRKEKKEEYVAHMLSPDKLSVNKVSSFMLKRNA